MDDFFYLLVAQDHHDPAVLLSCDNINLDALRNFAREVADVVTLHQLPAASLEFARNHLNEDDVAVFDFTKLHQAEHACRVVERHGRRLLLGIVGDVLHEVGERSRSLCIIWRCVENGRIRIRKQV